MSKTIYLQSENNQEVAYSYESLTDLKGEFEKRQISIAPNASVGTDVRLGNNITIGERAKIRSGSSIGSNTTFGDDIVVEKNVKIGSECRIGDNSTVFESAKIGDRVLIKQDSDIGARSSIGSNSIIDTKASIGMDNIIEANATIGSRVITGSKTSIGTGAALGANAHIHDNGVVYDSEIVKANSVVRPPIKPVNLINDEQVEVFNNMNAKGVKYVAFGSFAVDAYEQARIEGSIKIWIEPSIENISKLNEALKESGKDRIATNFDPDVKRPIKNEFDKSTSHSFGIDFYPSINGFKSEEFQKIHDRSVLVQGVKQNRIPLYHDSKKEQLSINHMSPQDLFHNVGSTQSQAKEYNLNVLHKTMVDLNKQGQKLDIIDPLLYLDSNRTNMETKKSYISYPGHEDKPKEFVPKYEKRDFSQLRKDLDLELVLNHYGYSLSDKSKPNDVYRVYKSGIEGDSQRLAVMNNPKGDYKMYVDLNNTNFRGDSIEFVKFKEGGYKEAFPVMDSILGNPTYKQNVSQILPMKPATPGQFLNDEKLRQADILREYNATHIGEKKVGYLVNERLLATKTVLAPEFKHQILSVKKNSDFENTAFPLTSQKGNILSFDIRNKDYKALPVGGKWDGIWKTNDHNILLKDSDFTFKDKTVQLEKGTVGTLSKSAGIASFHIDHPVHGPISLPVDKDKHEFQKISANRIIISESPIDSLSYHQLSPPKEGEYRQYVSPAGNPSREQKMHISNLISTNPQAQFVIGMDGNAPGNRFAINYLGMAHPLRDVNNSIVPNITYVNPTKPKAEDKAEKEVGYNILKVEINHPKGDGQDNAKKSNDSIIDRLLAAINIHSVEDSKKAKESSESRSIVEKPSAFTSSYEIKFPNISKMLSTALDYLANEITLKDGKPLVAILRPSSVQNDFNDVLKERKGQPLPESSNLSLSRIPLLSDFAQKREQSQNNSIAPSPSVSPKASFNEPAMKAATPEAPTPIKKHRI